MSFDPLNPLGDVDRLDPIKSASGLPSVWDTTKSAYSGIGASVPGPLVYKSPFTPASGASSVWGTTKSAYSGIGAAVLDTLVYKSPFTPASEASSVWGTTKSAYSGIGASVLDTGVYKSPLTLASGLSNLWSTAESSRPSIESMVLGTEVVKASVGVSILRFEYFDDFVGRSENRLDLLLRKLDPRLCKLWRGAHAAAASNNPDKTRHVCVSIRELMTHILHRLAPDKEIFEWTSDPSRFYKGKPTRESRFLYVCQGVPPNALSGYLTAEAKSMIALAKVLQKGTHGLGVEFSPLQLQVILNRIEGMLSTLIEIREL